MAYSTGFDAMLADTAVVSEVASVSTDGYGNPVYGSASTYKARHVRKQQMVRTFAGTEELSHSVVYVASTSTFRPSAQVAVNGTTMGPIMAAEAYPDRDGVHHVKLMFGN